MLIAVTGRLGSGKDTVYQRGALLAAQLGLPKAERLAFADPLKDSACAVLGITRERMEELKRDESTGLAWVLDGLSADYTPEITMRTFLQRYGTEAHRDIFGQDFWVKATLPDYFNHEKRLVFITDCRFPNEAERVAELGGFVVRVTRASSAGDGYDHASEKPLPDEMIDYELSNDYGPDDHFSHLDADVHEMLKTLMQWDGDA